ncbi:hypothetical protein ILYODFUR_018801, partial [Ilyodon furcidens]
VFCRVEIRTQGRMKIWEATSHLCSKRAFQLDSAVQKMSVFFLSTYTLRPELLPFLSRGTATTTTAPVLLIR